MGALLSQAGSLHPREDAEGTKMACHLYQQAAGTFQKLRRGPASEVLGKKPPDLGSDALEMVRRRPAYPPQVFRPLTLPRWPVV